MNILLFLLLTINLVYFAVTKAQVEHSSLPFYIKGYPKVSSVINDLNLEFEIVVTKDLNTSDFSNVKTPAFQFTLLPPSSLKYVSEITPLELIVETVVSNHSIPFPRTLSRIPNDLFKTGLFDSCKFEEAESILSKMDPKYQPAVGYHTKKSLKTTLSSLSPKETLAVDIKSSKYQTQLKKGTYKWVGKFNLRDDIKTETSVNDYYDEFVLALSVGEEGVKGEEAEEDGEGVDDDTVHCITQHPISSAIMFKHFETTKKSFIGCRALDFDHSDHTVLEKLHQKIEPSGIFEFDRSKYHLNFNFTITMVEKHRLSYIVGDTLDIVITFPEFFKEFSLPEDILCKSTFTPSLTASSCSYDLKTGTLTMSVKKSDVKQDTPYSLKLNLTSTRLLEHLSESYEFAISVYSKNSSTKPIIPEEELSGELSKAGGNLIPQCIDPVKSLFRKTEEYLNSQRYLVTSSKVKVNGDDYLSLFAYLERDGSNMIMNIFFQDHFKMWDKNFKIVIEPMEEKFKFSKPIEYDYNTLDVAVTNKAVKIEDEKITIDFHSLKASSMTRTDIYQLFSIYFNTSDGRMEKLLPENLKFSLLYEDGSELKKVIHIMKNRYYNNRNTFIKNKDTWVYGPYLRYGDKVVKMLFRVKFEKHKKVLVHLNFKDVKNAKSLKGSIETLFDPKATVKTKTDGKKFIQFEIDSAAEVDGAKMSLVMVEFEVDEVKSFSAKDVGISVVADPTTTESLDLSLERTILISNTIQMEDLEEYVGNYSPCLSGGTRFSSSRFRSGENANYLFLRLVDCKRPWLRPSNYTESEFIDVSVEPKYSITPTITYKEILGADDYNKNKAVKMLIDERRFYEHTLYVYFDEDSFYKFTWELNVLSKPEKITGKDKVIKKALELLFKGSKDPFTNIVVGVGHSNYIDVYLARDSTKEIDTTKKVKFENLGDSKSFEKFIDLALANARTDVMGSSFSVIAVLYPNLVDELKWKSEIYYADVNEFSGLKIPVLVDVITLAGQTLDYKVDSLLCDKKYIETNSNKWYNFVKDEE